MNESIPPSKVLGVFGMSMFTRRDDLEKVFSGYGPIEKVEIIMNRQVKTTNYNPNLLCFFYFRLEDQRVSVSFTLNAWKTLKSPV